MWDEFAKFWWTEDFRRNLYVALTAVAIELMLLCILGPLVVYLYGRRREQAVRHWAYFYLFQVFHKVARVLLNVGGIDEGRVTVILEEEQQRNPQFQLFSHYVYGNLENLLFLVRERVLADRASFEAELAKRSPQELAEYIGTLERCLQEMDYLTLAMLTLPRMHRQLFHTRFLVYGLRDQLVVLRDAVYTAEARPDRVYEFYSGAACITAAMGGLLSRGRGLVDARLRWMRRKQDARAARWRWRRLLQGLLVFVWFLVLKPVRLLVWLLSRRATDQTPKGDSRANEEESSVSGTQKVD